MDSTDDKVINLIKHQKRNRKLMLFYKMLSYDLLFYYTISFLFLVRVKGFSASQIVFGETFYPIFKILFQSPCTFLVQKMGKRNSLIIANLSLVIYILFIIFLTNPSMLIVANIFCSFGYVIKGMCESTLLYDSIEDSSLRGEVFSKYEGRANSFYYFFDAITSLLTGYLFIINPYLPLVLSLICLLISTLLAFGFKELKKVHDTTSLKEDFKIYFSDLRISSKFIIRSNRLKSLIIFNSLLIAILTTLVTLRTSLLNELHVSSELFGIIFAVMGIISCYAANKAIFMHKKFRNKTLSVIGILISSSMIVCSLAVSIKLLPFFKYYIILIMFSIQYYCRGAFQILIKQYLNSFCDSKMRVKIYSANSLMESLVTAFFSYICSVILAFMQPSKTFMIIGIIYFVLIVLVLKYMKSHLGLKPEEYPEKDIDYSDLL